MYKKITAGFVFLMFTLVAVASPLTVELKVFSVDRDASGEEVFTEVEIIQPGQILEYRATYSNVSEGTLNGVTPEVPVPAGMIVILDKAHPEVVAASVDGAHFASLPLLDQSGEPTPVDKIRAVRWAPSKLAPGSDITVRLRTRVEG